MYSAEFSPTETVDQPIKTLEWKREMKHSFLSDIRGWAKLTKKTQTFAEKICFCYAPENI